MTGLPAVVRQSLQTKSPEAAKKLTNIVVSKICELKGVVMAKELEMTFKMNLMTVPTIFGDVKFEREDPNEELEMAVDFMLKNPQLMLTQSNQLPNKSISITETDNSEQLPTIKTMAEKWSIDCLKLTQKEQESHKRYMQILLHMYGDLSIDLNGHQVDELLNVTARMPRGNIKQYSQMSITERIESALKDEVPETDQVTSSKHALKTFQGFFSWLVSKRCLDVTPLKQRRVEPKKGQDRGAFDIPIAEQIVEYAKQSMNLKLKWQLLIMAYSGMRNGEIQSLRKGNIYRCQTTNIWYIQIQKAKTDSSTRRIPLAQSILDLGFIDYVSSFQNSTDRLFNVSDRYLTSAYSRISKKLGLPSFDVDGNQLSLYSFRHTVISLIRANGANEFQSMTLSGHKTSAKGKDVHDGYSHPRFVTLGKLKAIVDALEYKTYYDGAEWKGL
jgi:integrase